MIHTDYISAILSHLRVPPSVEPGRGIYLFDPLCGKGWYAEQIAAVLGVDGVYGVEPNKIPGETAPLPGGIILSPCSPHHLLATGGSFGLAFVVPPAVPVELAPLAMVNRVTPLLSPHGVLVMICPVGRYAGSNSHPAQLSEAIDTSYENVSLYRMPTLKGVPRDENVVLIGSKRTEPTTVSVARQTGSLCRMQIPSFCGPDILTPLGKEQPVSWRYGNPVGKEDSVRSWVIPATVKPHTFKKIGYSLAEKVEMLENSPLNKHLESTTAKRTYEPPLTPVRGHIGTILAAGILDGKVKGPDGHCHVVRGSSFKARYQDHSATTRTVSLETGITTLKERFSEMPVTVIRCVLQWPTPRIKTFSNQPEEISLNP